MPEAATKEKQMTTKEIVEQARQDGPGAPGSEVGDTGYFWSMDGTPNVPQSKGSKFVPGGDARMMGLTVRHLDGDDEYEFNEHQLAYVKEHGLIEKAKYKAEKAAEKRERQEADAERKRKAAEEKATKAEAKKVRKSAEASEKAAAK